MLYSQASFYAYAAGLESLLSSPECDKSDGLSYLSCCSSRPRHETRLRELILDQSDRDASPPSCCATAA